MPSWSFTHQFSWEESHHQTWPSWTAADMSVQLQWLGCYLLLWNLHHFPVEPALHSCWTETNAPFTTLYEHVKSTDNNKHPFFFFWNIMQCPLSPDSATSEEHIPPTLGWSSPEQLNPENGSRLLDNENGGYTHSSSQPVDILLVSGNLSVSSEEQRHLCKWLKKRWQVI